MALLANESWTHGDFFQQKKLKIIEAGQLQGSGGWQRERWSGLPLEIFLEELRRGYGRGGLLFQRRRDIFERIA